MIADDPLQWRDPAYEPTERDRTLVRKLATLGLSAEKIAARLGIELAVMLRELGDDLEQGLLEQFGDVKAALWQNAAERRDVGARIFWMKPRPGWISASGERRESILRQIFWMAVRTSPLHQECRRLASLAKDGDVD